MSEFEILEKKSYDHLIEGYRILNSIKPFYFQTKYPFNAMSPQKIIFTENKIEILAKDYEKFIMDKKSKDEGVKNNTKSNKSIFSSKITTERASFNELASDTENTENAQVEVGSDVRTDGYTNQEGKTGGKRIKADIIFYG